MRTIPEFSVWVKHFADLNSCLKTFGTLAPVLERYSSAVSGKSHSLALRRPSCLPIPALSYPRGAPQRQVTLVFVLAAVSLLVVS